MSTSFEISARRIFESTPKVLPISLATVSHGVPAVKFAKNSPPLLTASAIAGGTSGRACTVEEYRKLLVSPLEIGHNKLQLKFHEPKMRLPHHVSAQTQAHTTVFMRTCRSANELNCSRLDSVKAHSSPIWELNELNLSVNFRLVLINEPNLNLNLECICIS